MSSPYRPSPFLNNPTVVMEDKKSAQPRSTPLFRYFLYGALVLAIAYAAWTWLT